MVYVMHAVTSGIVWKSQILSMYHLIPEIFVIIKLRVALEYTSM